jgi:hypothetical protein
LNESNAARQAAGNNSGLRQRLVKATLIRWRRASAPPRRLDGSDVDLLHWHHRLEGTFRLTVTWLSLPPLTMMIGSKETR